MIYFVVGFVGYDVLFIVCLNIFIDLWFLFYAENFVQFMRVQEVFKLAAMLRGSRPGVQSVSRKTPKNTSFLGVTQPPGVVQPLYSRGHN